MVNAEKNCWVDFGESSESGGPLGGSVLDLVMRYFRVEVKGGLALLHDLAGRPGVATLPEPAARPATLRAVAGGEQTFCDVEFSELRYPPLVSYLRERGIHWELVQRSRRTMAHLQQVFYQVPGSARPRPYFALAWKTSAGHEVRSARFQNCLGGKGVTYLPGTQAGCMVFEGFMDYLSALTYYKRPSFRCSVLVLNSVSLLSQALALLVEEPVIHCFLDNDAAGIKALTQLQQWLPAGRVKSYHELYRGYKDFNDFLTRTPPKRPLPLRRQAPSLRSERAKWWLWVVFEGKPQRDGRDKCCTFYTYSNDEAGFTSLLNLRHELQHQLAYYRLCERTQGRQFRVLAQDGISRSHPTPPSPPATAVPAGSV